MTQNIHNLKHLEECRKELRKNSTSAEATLWKKPQKSQLKGRKFRRQHSIKHYIVDFYCPKEQLIGAYHLDFLSSSFSFVLAIDFAFRIVSSTRKKIRL
tara:strand:- start:293 stop:589 length:297 start_codon:yes stop_codon:yes gene_type:complete